MPLLVIVITVIVIVLVILQMKNKLSRNNEDSTEKILEDITKGNTNGDIAVQNIKIALTNVASNLREDNVHET